MLSWESVPELKGRLVYYPFTGFSFSAALAEEYKKLTKKHGRANVLVLTRYPSTLDTVRETITDTTDSIREPNVHALLSHARSLVDRLERPPDVLSETERRAIVRDLVRAWEWDETTPYIASAHEKNGFVDDVSQFVTKAVWQGASVISDDDDLDELGDFLGEYRRHVASMDAIGLPDVVRHTVRAFQHSGDADSIATLQSSPVFDVDARDQIDAVLVVGFEEFARIDRAYLAHLSKESELVCFARADSAVQRPWNEPGRITDLTSLTVDDRTDEESIRKPTEAAAAFLATGANPPEFDSNDSIHHLSAETFRDQIQRVASEIERIVAAGKYDYDDVGVVLRDATAPIQETIDELSLAGVPVGSITVAGMSDDPAVRELYNVAALVRDQPVPSEGELRIDHSSESAGESDQHPSPLPDDDSTLSDAERRFARLRSRVDSTDEEFGKDIGDSVLVPLRSESLCAVLGEVARTEGLADALKYWMERTQLVHRVARDEDPRTAKAQFDNVSSVLALAEYYDSRGDESAPWESYVDALADEMGRSGTDHMQVESTRSKGTVSVDAARAFKHDSREFVFVLDLVEDEFPTRPTFNRLFPAERLETLSEYPALTTPTSDDVDATFGDGARGTHSPSPRRAYYYALQRRYLAIAANAAVGELFFCTYKQEAGILADSRQPSRFLRLLEDQFGEFDTPEREQIRTRGDAISYVTSRFDHVLEEARRRTAVGEPFDMDDANAEFRIAATLLDELDDPDIREAIRARIDLGTGKVLRDA